MNQKQTTFLVNLQTFVPFGSLLQVLPFRFSLMGNVDIARMLIERGANVSTQDEDGPTALHLASENDVDLARMLIERGADVSAQKKDREIAPFLSLRNGDVDIAQMLIERGADVSVRNEDG